MKDCASRCLLVTSGRTRTKVDSASPENEPCKVLDCIINPEICAEMKKKTDTELLAFFREILVTYVFQKHKVELSVEEFKLPKLEYKGNFVDFQRVRAKKNPKIEVVETKTSETQPGTKEDTGSATAFAGGPRDPDWKLMIVNTDNEVTEFDGFNLLEAKELLIVFELSILVTGKHISIQVSEKMLVLTCGKIYNGRIRLPLEVVPDKTHAVFVTAERVLNVTLTPKSRQLTSEEQEENKLFEGGSQQEPSAAQVLLEENRRKIEKNNIVIQSGLLTDIF